MSDENMSPQERDALEMLKKANLDNKWVIEADARSDDEVELIESESESEDEEDGADLLNTVFVAEPVKQTVVPTKKLSKKEKDALKKKELDEMDDIFNEMGITLESTPASAVEASPVEERTDNSDKDKKKKKKKAAGKAKAVAVEVVATPLSAAEIKAKLLAKTAALSKPVSVAVNPAVAAQKAEAALRPKQKKSKGLNQTPATAGGSASFDSGHCDC